RARAGIYKYKTKAYVGGDVAAEAELMCTMRQFS
ncbi:MAG: 3-hydroxyacyl-[acyl-carrier-protein] dehydratase FabZ, partial [Rubrivivax sp.]|nr:3-hydroxyacyl-[acyl-carrier-protein] dehydratase FabZ [Rubrivivax sp.]